MFTEKFDHYRLDGLLGEGTFGTVYRGTDVRNGTVVAVKVFDRGDAQAMLGILRAEARVMREIEHPNCVRVLDVIEREPPALVTEYIHGATLRAVLNRAGRLTGQQSLDVVRGALLGLAAVHESGLRHGDVKPDNILIDGSGVSRLIDFGLVQNSPQPEGSVITGSPAYMSPEQVRGGSVDHRSDLYAFAAILFELLTGRRPFPAGAADEVMRRHITDPVPDAHAVNPDVSTSLASVCSTGLAKDPAARYQSAAEFLHALEQAARHTYGSAWAAGTGLGALAGAAVHTVATTGQSDHGRTQRRVPVRGLAVAGGLVVVVVVGYLIWPHTHRQQVASARRITPTTSSTNHATPSSTSSTSRNPRTSAVGSTAAAFVAPASVASNVYYSASCPTAQICLATGHTGSGRPLESVTRDGGASWTTTYLSVPAPLGLLSCSNAMTCVAGYYQKTVHMSRTGDGGRTWLAAVTPRVTNLQSIACPTPERCLAVGGLQRNGSGTAQAIATDDGGATWRRVAVPGPANSVSCADAAHCWVSGSFNKVWATNAAGAAWRPASPPTTFPPPAAGAGPFPANTVFPMQGRIGQVGFYLDGVAFSSDTNGIAFGGALCGGYKATRCASGMYRTTDGARTWTFWSPADEKRYGDGAYAFCVGSSCLTVTDTFTNSVLISTADGVHWSERHEFKNFAGRVTCSNDGATCVVIGSTGLWVSHV